MKIAKIGIDLGKNVFHLHGVNERDKVIPKKKASRAGARKSHHLDISKRLISLIRDIKTSILFCRIGYA